MQGIRRNEGFTLFEIMAALVIVAILAAAGFPAMSTVMSNTRMNKAASTMAMAIAQARSQAISSNGFVSLVAGSKDSPMEKVTATATDADNIVAWSDGWRVLKRPLNAANKLEVSGAGVTQLGQDVLGFVPASSTAVAVYLMNTGTNTQSGIPYTISFNKLGQLVDENGVALTKDVQVWVCDGGRAGEKGRRLVINRRGNVKNLLVGATGYDNPCT